ncbi:MAG: hypothetical protein R3D25_00450 [Geminicoccaceae bacterium]
MLLALIGLHVLAVLAPSARLQDEFDAANVAGGDLTAGPPSTAARRTLYM